MLDSIKTLLFVNLSWEAEFKVESETYIFGLLKEDVRTNFTGIRPNQPVYQS